MVLRSEEHTSELQSHVNLVCRLLLEKNNPSASFFLGSADLRSLRSFPTRRSSDLFLGTHSSFTRPFPKKPARRRHRSHFVHLQYLVAVVIDHLDRDLPGFRRRERTADGAEIGRAHV